MRILFSALLFIFTAAAQTVGISLAIAPAYEGHYHVAPGALIVATAHNPVYGFNGVDDSVRLEMQPEASAQLLEMKIVATEEYRVWAVVPEDAPLGRAAVIMTLKDARLIGSMQIDRSSFGLFTTLPDASGPALAQNITEDGPLANGLTTPALPGQYVTLWGTGLGDFAAEEVSVKIYDLVAKPAFAGRAPGMPGVDQINFRMPLDVPGGCYVPVTVTVGGADVSNEVVLATATEAGTPCQHPLGLTAEELARLDQGGQVMIGSMDYGSLASPSYGSRLFQRYEVVNARFFAADSAVAFTVPLIPHPTSPVCTLGGQQFGVSYGGGSVGPKAYADAGLSLVLAGPANRRVVLPRTSDRYPMLSGDYRKTLDEPPAAASIAALAPPVLAGGDWVFSAPGGKEIGPFQQTITLAPSLNWTNRGSLSTIDRNQDLTVTWEVAGDLKRGFATVELATTPPSPVTPIPNGLAAGVSCTVAAETGTLTIGRELLQQIVPTLSGFHSTLGLSVSTDYSRPTLVRLPVVAGGQAPFALHHFSDEAIPVVIR